MKLGIISLLLCLLTPAISYAQSYKLESVGTLPNGNNLITTGTAVAIHSKNLKGSFEVVFVTAKHNFFIKLPEREVTNNSSSGRVITIPATSAQIITDGGLKADCFGIKLHPTRDVAFIKVRSPINFRTCKVLSEPPETGSKLVCYGYGTETKTGWQVNYSNNIPAPRRPISGDSGGPVYYIQDKTPYLVGVITGFSHKPDGSRDSLVYTSSQEIMLEETQQVRYCPPNSTYCPFPPISQPPATQIYQPPPTVINRPPAQIKHSIEVIDDAVIDEAVNRWMAEYGRNFKPSASDVEVILEKMLRLREPSVRQRISEQISEELPDIVASEIDLNQIASLVVNNYGNKLRSSSSLTKADIASVVSSSVSEFLDRLSQAEDRLADVESRLNSLESNKPTDLTPILDEIESLRDEIDKLRNEPQPPVELGEAKNRILYFTSSETNSTLAKIDARVRTLKESGYPVTIITLDPKKVEVSGVPRIHEVAKSRDVTGLSAVSTYLDLISL